MGVLRKSVAAPGGLPSKFTMPEKPYIWNWIIIQCQNVLVYNLCTVLKLFHGRDIMCKESCKKRYLLIVICPCNHNPSPLTLARRIAADSCPPAAANPSPVDPVHTSRPGELLIPPNFSPGGLLIPPNFPREFFLGGRKGSGCRGRAEWTEATATSTTCHGLRGLEGPWGASRAVCVMCSCLLCPYLVCFLSSSDVIIS